MASDQNFVPPSEILYSDDRVEQIGGLYEAAKENLTAILADLVPAAWCQESPNPKITHLYNQIAQLRDHCFDKVQVCDATEA